MPAPGELAAPIDSAYSTDSMSRVLVVEDYPPIAAVMGVAFRRLGHEVTVEASVSQVRLCSGRFDTAVCDLELPDGDGVEVAIWLRAQGKVPAIVFFTASRDARQLDRAREYGTVVGKQEGLDVLIDLVERQLRVEGKLGRVVGASTDHLELPSGRSGLRRRVR